VPKVAAGQTKSNGGTGIIRQCERCKLQCCRRVDLNGRPDRRPIAAGDQLVASRMSRVSRVRDVLPAIRGPTPCSGRGGGKRIPSSAAGGRVGSDNLIGGGGQTIRSLQVRRPISGALRRWSRRGGGLRQGRTSSELSGSISKASASGNDALTLIGGQRLHRSSKASLTFPDSMRRLSRPYVEGDDVNGDV